MSNILRALALSLLSVGSVPVALAQDSAESFRSEARAALLAERERRQAEIDRLMALKAPHSEEILALPGVTGLGIGATDGRLVFRVMVDPAADMPPVPERIEGVPVEVQRRAPLRLLDTFPNCTTGAGAPCHSQTLPLPVEMGNSGSPSNAASSGACTLGFKACEPASGRTVFVTNSHCSQNVSNCSLNASGSFWVHPGRSDTVSNPNTCLTSGTCTTIGEVSGHGAPSCSAGASNLTDATKVSSTGAQTLLAIRDIGIPAGQGSAQPDDLVQKSGRTTGWTLGQVTTVGMDIPVETGDLFCCGPLTMHDQIEFSAVPGLAGGDSGSALIGADPELGAQVLGLIFGSSVDAGGNAFGFANRVSNVLSALDLSLNFVRCVSDCLVTTASLEMGGAGERVVRLVRAYRDGPMAASPAGVTLTAIYDQYSDQAVKLARADPDLMRATVRLLSRLGPALETLEPGGTVPVTRADLDALRDLLGRYALRASPDMQRALRTVRRTLDSAEGRRDLRLALR